MDLVNEDKIKLSSKAAGNVNIYKCISKLEVTSYKSTLYVNTNVQAVRIDFFGLY
jgi:hypothetical protein